MELEAAGALVIAGNTDIAVADGDYARPSPGSMRSRAGHRAAAEWARDLLRDDQLEYLRRLPAERRVAVGRRAGPGLARLAGQPDQRPVRRTRRGRHRAARDSHGRARHLLWPHARRRRARAGPQAPRQPGLVWLRLRRHARRLLGPAHPGRWPGARGRAVPCRAYDAHPAAEEVAERGLPGDVYRAATIRTGRFVR